MVQTGLMWANADEEERREAENYPSLQTKIEDLIDKAEDIMALPALYPNLFELVEDSIVRPTTPKAYACMMDTAGYFRIGFRLHKMRGSVLASGQDATKESLTQVLNGEEPECGSDYIVDDVVASSAENYKTASYSNVHNKLDASARIYVYTATCTGITKRRYMVEVLTGCYCRVDSNGKWRADNTKVAINKLTIKANGLHNLGGDYSNADFDYQENVIDKTNMQLNGIATCKSVTYEIGEIVNFTEKSFACPAFNELHIEATNDNISGNKVVIDYK
ncbi:MAG: hypothetical protein IKR17_12465 [Bacteroidales bacterium]|nr:hypothetical protein [Bacteroidales bacterium]